MRSVRVAGRERIVKAGFMAGARQVDSPLAPVRRRGALLALVLGAALLHLALLDGALRLWPSAAPTPAAPAPAPAALPTLSVRTLAAPPAAPQGPTVLADAALPEAAPAASPRAAAKGAALRPSRPVAVVAAPPAANQPDPIEPLRPTPEPAAVEARVPVYRTAIATSMLLRYRVRRGALQGTAELDWRAGDETYDAQLAIELEGGGVTRQASQGGFDVAGLAPRRFTDRRRRGGVQAANFERERGEVMFSGPTHRLALVAGAQDRLSWLLQLGAVLQAEPHRSASGEELVFTVVGARGDGRPWVFRFESVEPVQTEAGPVDAVKWVREPDAPYDTRIEVWLAPSMQYLPVRLRSGSMAGAGPLELTLAP